MSQGVGVGSQAEARNTALFSARRLRLAREARGLTRVAVASSSELTTAAISQFEKGDARPAPHTLQRLAKALEFPVQFFAIGTAPSSYDPPLRTRSTTAATSARCVRSA